ncbi:MAG: PepSY domain-containing protein, partial [Eubacteriales bacterium]|nr:PepSY domain-containing protein [Eubacteriales bacterium]
MKKIKNRNLKITAMLVALALVLGVGGFSASRIVQASAFDSARNAARGVVPTAAELLDSELDDDAYQFEFYDELYDEYYEVSVDKKDRSQIKVTSRVESVQVTQQIDRTREEVEAVVRAVYPDAEITSVSLSEYEKGYVYKVVFAGNAVRGQVSVHPQSGQIISRSLRYGSSMLVMTNPTDDDDDAIKPLTDRYISLEQARLIALEAVPNASIHEMEYGEDDERLTIEVEMTREGWEFEVTIDAQTGDVLEIERDDGTLQT